MVLTFLRDKSRAPFAESAAPLPQSWLNTRNTTHLATAMRLFYRSGTQGKAGLFGALQRRRIRKNEAKPYGIWAALQLLAKLRNVATESPEILFKKTLTQTGTSENLSPHTE